MCATTVWHMPAPYTIVAIRCHPTEMGGHLDGATLEMKFKCGAFSISTNGGSANEYNRWRFIPELRLHLIVQHISFKRSFDVCIPETIINFNKNTNWIGIIKFISYHGLVMR